MRSRTWWLSVAVLLLSPAARSEPLPPDAGALFDGDLTPVSDAAFAERAREVPFVLLGGGRDQQCDRSVQARLLDALRTSGLTPTVGLAMVADDQQPVLDLFNAGRIEPQRLGDALAWAQNWTGDFRQYLPMLERAQASQSPVVALNVPPYLSFLAAQGRLPARPASPSYPVPADVIPVPPGNQPMWEDPVGEESQFFARFTPAEQSRDDLLYMHELQASVMAANARRAAKRFGQPVVILAGSSQVAYGSGIADHLRASGARTFVVLPWRGGPPPAPRTADLFASCPGPGPSR